MEDFKVFYDEEEDILYLAKEGEEAKASRMFKDVLKLMEKKLQVA
ncbi:MAG: hypothetical protein AABZ21_00665 [Deltaproteobacteria bacterium]